MKKVTFEIVETFNEKPVGAIKSLIGQSIVSIYTANSSLNSAALLKSQDIHEKIFFKTFDGFIYKLMSKGYTEECYLDVNKIFIELVETIEDNFFEYRLPIMFTIGKIFVFSRTEIFFLEKDSIKEVYATKWHSQSRGAKFKEEYFPDIYEAKKIEDSHLVFMNKKAEFLAMGIHGLYGLSIITDELNIRDLFTGETWLKEGVPSPYILSRTIE